MASIKFYEFSIVKNGREEKVGLIDSARPTLDNGYFIAANSDGKIIGVRAVDVEYFIVTPIYQDAQNASTNTNTMP